MNEYMELKVDLSIDQIAVVIGDGLRKGLTVEINTPAISGGYEQIGDFQHAGDGFARVKVRGMSWMEYLVPANTILGVRMYKDVNEDD